MQISKKQISLQKKSSGLMSGMRIIAGFTLAPAIGPIAYYLLLGLTGKIFLSMSLELSSLVWATIMVGSVIYIPMAGLSVATMMFIKRYYSWNIYTCTIGTLCTASFVMILLMILQSLTGTEYLIIGGLQRLMTMVLLPAVFWGISFWLIAVYKNKNLGFVFHKSTESNDQLMPSIQETA